MFFFAFEAVADDFQSSFISGAGAEVFGAVRRGFAVAVAGIWVRSGKEKALDNFVVVGLFQYRSRSEFDC